MLEKAKIGIPCPECGKKTSKSIAWIKAHNDFVCSKCASVVGVEGEKLLAAIKQAEKSVGKLSATFARINKRR